MSNECDPWQMSCEVKSYALHSAALTFRRPVFAQNAPSNRKSGHLQVGIDWLYSEGCVYEQQLQNKRASGPRVETVLSEQKKKLKSRKLWSAISDTLMSHHTRTAEDNKGSRARLTLTVWILWLYACVCVCVCVCECSRQRPGMSVRDGARMCNSVSRVMMGRWLGYSYLHG